MWRLWSWWLCAASPDSPRAVGLAVGMRAAAAAAAAAGFLLLVAALRAAFCILLACFCSVSRVLHFGSTCRCLKAIG